MFLNLALAFKTVKDLFRTDSDPEYLRKKIEGHRTLMTMTYVMFALFAPGLWLWDYVTDPKGSANTLVFRLSHIILLGCGIAFFYVRNYRLLRLITISSVLYAELLYILILTHLQDGMTYGIGGFMYFLILPLILCQGFSLRFNMWLTCTVSALPPLMALAGFLPGFQHDHYAVLIWPAAGLIIVIVNMFSANDLQRYRAECALEVASNTDPLTGVSNRRHFERLLKRELTHLEQSRQHASLLMLDIDHFKKINDAYGHPTGDKVICTLSEICCGTSRKAEQVARLGGEEFAVLLLDTDSKNAEIIAERIRMLVQDTAVQSAAADQAVRWTVSVGIATQTALDPVKADRPGEALVARADAALYRAKQTGRNRVVVDVVPPTQLAR